MLRALVAGVLALAVVLVAVLMFGRGGSYDIVVELPTASGLVKGDQVKIGGVPIGSVDTIELGDDATARVGMKITDEETVPLHEGTVAVVRATSLSGIANRYIALQPGRNDEPEMDEGATIPSEDAQPQVDLDQILNTLGPATQQDLRTLVHNSSKAFDSNIAEMNAGLEAIAPALSQGARTSAELAGDQSSLERFVVESAGVVTQLASRPEDLESAVADTRGTLDAVASETDSLDSSLRRLPPVLRRTNTTLVNVRAALGDIRPAVREARPAAKPLATLLRRLRPVARRGRPVIARLTRAVDRPGRGGDLLDVLQKLPPLAKSSIPAFESTEKVVADAQPIVDDARPYTPDLIGGLFNGFGGATGGYYDANGHFARISAQASVYSLANFASLVPLPAAQQGLTGYRKGVTKRCPGAAQQALPDGSSPNLERPASCNPADSPR